MMEMPFKTMLSESVQQLRSFTRMHRSPEPQEAPAKNAEQGKDTFFRSNTTRPQRPMNKARQELLGDAPLSPQRTSPVWRFIARRGQSLPIPKQEILEVEPESPLRASSPCIPTSRIYRGSQSKPTTPLGASARGQRAPSLTLSSSAAQELCLAHPCGGCSCVVAKVATLTACDAWKEMGTRVKMRNSAKFFQEQNKLAARAARRGAPRASKSPFDAHRRVASRAGSSFKDSPSDSLRRVASRACAGCKDSTPDAPRRVGNRTAKLIPLPPPISAQEGNPMALASQRLCLSLFRSGA
ncbi:hypothetical protein T484DRAFT_1982622 [Baffinella frigidus]|nr:hypothetical protein T484DRAFT_1982622 [Cryptophyta sp. CCMP2293]